MSFLMHFKYNTISTIKVDLGFIWTNGQIGKARTLARFDRFYTPQSSENNSTSHFISSMGVQWAQITLLLNLRYVLAMSWSKNLTLSRISPT